MPYEDRAWTPIVAERETSAVQRPATGFPCRGEFNRYTGCIGARKCRALGVKQCILGRWPDERQLGSALSRGLVEEPTAPLPRESARPERPPVAAPAISPATPRRGHRAIGVIHADRQIAQSFSKHLQSAGYTPTVFASADEAAAALAGADRPAALLVDGKLLHHDPAGERLLNTAAASEIPVLSLPANLRAHTSAEPAIRMATVWLTVTLRDGDGARRAG